MGFNLCSDMWVLCSQFGRGMLLLKCRSLNFQTLFSALMKLCSCALCLLSSTPDQPFQVSQLAAGPAGFCDLEVSERQNCPHCALCVGPFLWSHRGAQYSGELSFRNMNSSTSESRHL